MSKKIWKGQILPQSYPYYLEGEVSFGGIARRTRSRLMGDTFNNATVLGEISRHEATDEKPANVTITVALAGPNNIRRVSAFTPELIAQIEKLEPGDVLDIAGTVMPASQNSGTPGFRALAFGDIKEKATPGEVTAASLDDDEQVEAAE